MEKKLNIDDLRWKTSDEEYHNLQVMCYSALSKYLREGFNAIQTLWDKIESPSLTIGSAIDTLVTEPEQFKALFYNMNSDIDTSSKTAAFINKLVESTDYADVSFDTAVQSVSIKALANEVSFYSNLKEETIIKKLYEDINIETYYNDVKKAEGRKMLTLEQQEIINNSITALHNNPLSQKLLFEQPPEGVERFFQVKFLVELEGITFKVMFDMLLVDHNNKTIYIYDLKSTSKKVWEFPQSFVQFNYQIQDRLYYRALEKILEDNGFSDYRISNMKNIVVSTTYPDVLLFEFEDTSIEGDLSYKKGELIMRDPINVAKELNANLNKQYPSYIENSSYNKLIFILTEGYANN